MPINKKLLSIIGATLGAVAVAAAVGVAGGSIDRPAADTVRAASPDSESPPYEVTHIPDGYVMGRTVVSDFPMTKGKNYLIGLEAENSDGPPLLISITTGITAAGEASQEERVTVNGRAATFSEESSGGERVVQHVRWVDERQVSVSITASGAGRDQVRKRLMETANGLRAR